MRCDDRRPRGDRVSNSAEVMRRRDLAHCESAVPAARRRGAQKAAQRKILRTSPAAKRASTTREPPRVCTARRALFGVRRERTERSHGPGVAPGAGVVRRRVRATRTTPPRPAARGAVALVVAWTLVLHILLPAVAAAAGVSSGGPPAPGFDPRSFDPRSVLCLGAAASDVSADAAAGEGGDRRPAPRSDQGHHASCVLCTTPGLAAAPVLPPLGVPTAFAPLVRAALPPRRPHARRRRTPVNPRAPPGRAPRRSAIHP